MEITDVWSLHFQNFLIQIEGTLEESHALRLDLKEAFPKKKYFIVVKGGGVSYEKPETKDSKQG